MPPLIDVDRCCSACFPMGRGRLCNRHAAAIHLKVACEVVATELRKARRSLHPETLFALADVLTNAVAIYEMPEAEAPVPTEEVVDLATLEVSERPVETPAKPSRRRP